MPAFTLPRRLSPQLCHPARHAPSGAAWIHEVKYDGWRLLARKDGARVSLFTRGGHAWTRKLPTIASAIAALPMRSGWLDGELVAFDREGCPDFDALAAVMRAPNQPGLAYQVWDLPWCEGRDWTTQPLLDRKARLAAVLAHANSRVRYTRHLEAPGPTVFAEVDAMGLEGIVSKRVDARYQAGVRCRDWQKIKAWRTETAILGGVEYDADGRLAALLVGTASRSGALLHYEGRIEFGFQHLRPVRRFFDDLTIPAAPFVGDWASTRRRWLAPEIPVRLQCLPRRPGRPLRHAVLTGLGA